LLARHLAYRGSHRILAARTAGAVGERGVRHLGRGERLAVPNLEYYFITEPYLLD